MRKLILAFLCSVVLFNFTGCGNSNSSGRTENKPADVVDVIEAGMAEENSKKSDTENPISNSIPGNSTDGIDVDLTALSSTMVYSEVFAMMTEPEQYIGKTIKMTGVCNRYTNIETGADYYACIITDVTACCSQGIEFKLPDGEKYPQMGTTITVMGTFGSYIEDGNEFYVLLDATLL